MDQSAISVRYAKAFFLTAKEKNTLGELKEDIETVFNVCNNSTEFMLLLKSPVVKTSKKVSIMKSVFEGNLKEQTINFLKLVTENKREVFIPSICRNFLNLTRKDQNIKTVQLTTATKINDEINRKIKTLLEKELNAKVELSENVNPEILGGLVIRIDDKQYDASVSTQLKNIQQKLLKTDIK